jgi:hypothetical protein
VVESADEALAATAREAAAGTGIEVDVRGGGSSAHSAPANGRLITLSTAGNAYARLASDRWPDALSMPGLAAQASAAAALVRSLAAK